ncbi:uncharacterized protein [Saccopteryx bilineata]|uniref:uncharacterized protein isoform X1 n=1 Tax=Saccopteryx bilineata TaxID=59482 RepID=UPI00338F103E
MTPFGGVGERQKWIRGKCHSTNIRDHPRKRQREGDAVAPRHALWKELDLPCGGLVLSRTRSARSPRRSDLSRSDQERRCLAGREARWADYPRAGPRARGQPRAAARRERAVLTPRRARGRRAGRTCPRRRRGGNTMDCLRAAWTLELEWNPQPAWDPERTPWAPVSRRLAHGTAPGRGNLDIDTHEEYHVTTAAEIGIILPQAKDAKDCWQSAEVRRKYLVTKLTEFEGIGSFLKKVALSNHSPVADHRSLREKSSHASPFRAPALITSAHILLAKARHLAMPQSQWVGKYICPPEEEKGA